MIPRRVAEPQGGAAHVPPPALWLGYGSNADEYLNSGKKDIATLKSILQPHAPAIESMRAILELGCAAGRMVRWLADSAGACEIWGVDIDATSISWCKQHLHPPLNFATTTIWPHLPFPDGFFNLVYAGSVFTHIDDLADAWFLELRRVIAPGGKLCITIHDKHTIELLDGPSRDVWLAQFLRNEPELKYAEYSRADFGMFTVGRGTDSQVFYDLDFLIEQISTMFRVLSVTPEAYGYQTVLLLERR